MVGDYVQYFIWTIFNFLGKFWVLALFLQHQKIRCYLVLAKLQFQPLSERGSVLEGTVEASGNCMFSREFSVFLRSVCCHSSKTSSRDFFFKTSMCVYLFVSKLC